MIISKRLICILSLVSFFTSSYAQLSSVDQFRFIENKGQWHAEAKYVSPIPDGSIILTDNSIFYYFYDGNKEKEITENSHHGNLETEATVATHTFKVSFLNGQIPTYHPSNELIEKRNYLKGNDATKWAQSIKAYETITYQKIYPGIDFTIQERNNTVKYEFIVQPGAKPKQIQLAYEGVESIQILNEQLIVQTSLGNVIDDKPFAYQIIGDSRKKVNCEYQLEDNVLSYKLGKYNKKLPLIIDPRLIFSTSSGSFADNWGNTACYDRRGNLYTGGTLFETSTGIGGTPFPTGFPTTIGAFQTTFQGGDTDMSIMKFDSSGTFLLYSTIIGGSGAEIPTSTVVNNNNELYILGTTASPDFPVTPGAFDTEFEGNEPLIIWYINGTPIDTGTTFTPPTLNDGDQVYAELESAYTCETDKNKTSNTITLNYPATPNTTISSPNPSFCPGGAVDFNALTTNGTSPTYQWFLNGVPVGTNSANYTLATPNNDDQVWVVATDISCTPLNDSDTSEVITIKNAAGDTASVFIESDHLPLCTGENYNFTATPTFGDFSGTFTWRRNGTLISTGPNLAFGGFINNDTLTVEYTSNMTCLNDPDVISNQLIIDNSLSPLSPTLNIIPQNYSICDHWLTFDAETIDMGENVSFQWKLNGFDLTGQTNPQFAFLKDFFLQYDISLEASSTMGCLTSSVLNTPPIVIDFDDTRPSSFEITSSTDSLCNTDPVTFTAQYEDIESQNYIPVGGYGFDRGTDIVVIHLNADGTNILNATYVGGRGNDGILESESQLVNNHGDQLRGDINLDSLGNVYVASSTASPDFPTVNPAQPIYGGGQTDAVAFKMPPNLSSLIFSTYLGGTESDGAYSIQTNDAQEVFIGGGTNSDNYPTNASAYIPTSQGNVDGFVTKLSTNGSLVTNSTRLGTNEFDQTYFVQLDTNGNVYALGQTKGQYPHLKSKYINPNSGLFLQKLSPDLSTPIYSTVLGDLDSTDAISPNISPTAFLINECENIFISGWGGETNIRPLYNYFVGPTLHTVNLYNGNNTFNLPLTSNAYQTTTDGSDFYLMALLKDADSLIYSTYFGGSVSEEHVDGGTSRFDYRGIVYQSVCSGCGGNTDFPTDPDDNSQGTYPKRNESDNCSNGVFKFDLATLEADFEHDEYCEPNTITFINLTNGGIDFTWDFGDGQSEFTLLPDTVRHTYDEPGIYTVSLIATDLTTCVGKDTAIKEIFVPEFFTANHQYDTICENFTQNLELLDFDPAFQYKWIPSAQLNNDSIYNPDFTADSTIQYLITVTDTNGCIKIDTFDIEVRPEVIADFEPISNCSFQKIILANTSQNATSYEWRLGSSEVYTTTSKDTIIRALPKGIYVINLQAFNDTTCNKSDFADSQTLVIFDSLTTAGDTTMCRWEEAHPRVLTGDNPIWESNSSLSCLNCTDPIATPITTTEYIVNITQDTCTAKDTITVTIIPDSLPQAIINVDPPRCYTDSVFFEGIIERNDCKCCEGIKSYLWTFDDGTTSREPNPRKLYTSAGVYETQLEIIARDTVYTTTYISLLDADSCIKNIYIPNAFTPNEDGENDLLFVRAIGIVELDFHLFNRWGEEIFSTTNKNIGWDGTYKGAIMSPQVFTYTCHATFWDGEKFYQEGNVTLLE